jgi:hypothetical protein
MIEDGVGCCMQCVQARQRGSVRATIRLRENALEMASNSGWQLVAHDYFQAYLVQEQQGEQGEQEGQWGEHGRGEDERTEPTVRVLALAEYEVKHTQQQGQAVLPSILNVHLLSAGSAGGKGEGAPSILRFQESVRVLAQREIAFTHSICDSTSSASSSSPATQAGGGDEDGVAGEDAAGEAVGEDVLLLAAAAVEHQDPAGPKQRATKMA